MRPKNIGTATDREIEAPAAAPGNYEDTRFNALQHGVLSQYTVLPWEDEQAYLRLLKALVAEHQPRGPTEEHLVEEIAGVIWRKRRLRLGERAAHQRALKRRTEPHTETAQAALIHVAAEVEDVSVSHAITATPEQTTAAESDLRKDRTMTEKAFRLLEGDTPSSYERALAALHGNTREQWSELLEGDSSDYYDDEELYEEDAESLKRFLETRVLPWYDKRQRELEYRPQIREQAFGEAVDPAPLERLARYEVHLDRKLARTLSMLMKLQELRRTTGPADAG